MMNLFLTLIIVLFTILVSYFIINLLVYFIIYLLFYLFIADKFRLCTRVSESAYCSFPRLGAVMFSVK